MKYKMNTMSSKARGISRLEDPIQDIYFDCNIANDKNRLEN